MDNEKVNEALAACRQQACVYTSWKILPKRCQDAISLRERLGHVLWMIEEATSWPAERLEKKFRWLGFVQGVLWACDVASVEDAKRMNMPKDEEFKP
jgi:hypothetical protein